MTFATTCVGLFPIMWATGAGSDVMKRIAAPMVGGIFTSFVLELLVYPAIYEIWRRASHPNLVTSEQGLESRACGRQWVGPPRAGSGRARSHLRNRRRVNDGSLPRPKAAYGRPFSGPSREIRRPAESLSEVRRSAPALAQGQRSVTDPIALRNPTLLEIHGRRGTVPTSTSLATRGLAMIGPG